MSFPIKTGLMKNLGQYANKTKKKEILITEDTKQLFFADGKGKLKCLNKIKNNTSLEVDESNLRDNSVLCYLNGKYIWVCLDDEELFYLENPQNEESHQANYCEVKIKDIEEANKKNKKYIDIIYRKNNKTKAIIFIHGEGFMNNQNMPCGTVGWKIVRNDKHYPKNIKDGKLIYSGVETIIEDVILENNKTYYYTIFFFDEYFNLVNKQFSSTINCLKI